MGGNGGENGVQGGPGRARGEGCTGEKNVVAAEGQEMPLNHVH